MREKGRKHTFGITKKRGKATMKNAKQIIVSRGQGEGERGGAVKRLMKWKTGKRRAEQKDRDSLMGGAFRNINRLV